MNTLCLIYRKARLMLLGLVKMEQITKFVETYAVEEARSAFYYLSRYLKQAEYYSTYEKDIFEDDDRSKPSAAAKELMQKILKYIEVTQGKNAAEFSTDEYLHWMQIIDDVETALEPELTEDELETTQEIIENMTTTVVLSKTSQ